MAILLVTVTQERLLQLPQEAQARLEPGQKLQIQIDQVSIDQVSIDQDAVLPPQTGPNEKALRALREIARRQKGRRHTDGSQTDQLLRDGRAGAMYGCEPRTNFAS